jgi:hypothetical protein
MTCEADVDFVGVRMEERDMQVGSRLSKGKAWSVSDPAPAQSPVRLSPGLG